MSVVTLRTYELGRSTPQRAALEVRPRALEAAGIIFNPADGEDAGVRLRRERT